MTTVAEIRLWGRSIAAAALGDGQAVSTFQYDPAFARSGIEIAPLMMPLGSSVYSFPALSRQSFHGLPGLLADSLPDKFGNALIDAWLATQGRTSESFNAIERLCYTGTRGMGALEFSPVKGPRARKSSKLDLDALVKLASDVLTNRGTLEQSFAPHSRSQALAEILNVGTSAGGARAKAIIAWNPVTHDVRSGQVRAPEGFGYWLLKFDGVSGNKDKELNDPLGYTVVEYAYSKMARAAGIEMTECELLEEGGRRHFMTKRFDRTDSGEKIHMQSLAALMHLDYNMADVNSYEQAFQCIKRLKLPMSAREQMFRRMLFNVVARNQDDHVKNIAFLMDKQGAWKLAPAFDVTFAYNRGGEWTARHQMSINGKRDHFVLADFLACAETAGLKRGVAQSTLDEVIAAVREWPGHAEAAGVPAEHREAISPALRLEFPRR